MKLFLTSAGLPPETIGEFLKLIGKKPEEATLCFITTASHPEEIRIMLKKTEKDWQN